MDPTTQARHWLAAAGEPEPRPASDDERRALGRALKAVGYEALYADRAASERAVRHLRALAPEAIDVAARRELGALADWVEGAARALGGQAGEAVRLLDAAREALAALGHAADAAATQVPKLIALAMLGRHDDALACGERTRDELMAAGDARAAGRVEINLGSMLMHQHRYAAAARQYRRAAARFARAGDRRHSVMADLGLALALAWQQAFDEAERIHARSQSRIAAHGLHDLQGVLDGNRGQLALHRGRHAEALRHLEAALRAFERDGAPQRLAEARRDLADAYLALNLLPEAVALYDLAIEASRARGATMEQAWAEMQRARARFGLGDLGGAAIELDEAERRFRAVGNAVGAARTACHAAALALRQGDPAGALERATQAAEALQRAGMRGWSAEARALAAEASLALGRTDAAERGFERLQAEADGPPELRVRALAGLAAVATARGDGAQAADHLDAAASLIEEQRRTLPGDEFRIAYGSDKQSVFDDLVALALGDVPARPLRTLARIERGRAQALALVQAAAAGTGEVEPDGQAERRSQLHHLQQQWQQAVALGDTARGSELGARVAEAERAMLEAHRRAQSAAARGRAVTGEGPRGAPWSEAAVEAAAATLDADEAFVAYARGGPGRLVALVARRQRLEQVVLDATDVPRRIEQLHFQIQALRFGAARLQRHSAQMVARTQVHLEMLYHRLWAPLEPALHGAARIAVSPHGVLHGVPFAALHDGDRALVDRVAIEGAVSLVRRAAARAEAASAARAPRRVLAVGHGGEALPHVTAELEGVARVFDGGARCLVGTAATLAALRDALPGADVLHLACHGRFRADSPYFSHVQLVDGPLSVRDAATLPLAGAHVTLSACETGLSRIGPGDERLGLVRGFTMGGAASVLATLWTVEDASTAVLMGHHYRGLAAGLAPAEALRRAQRLLRAERPHPYHWAPFVVHGRG